MIAMVPPLAPGTSMDAPMIKPLAAFTAILFFPFSTMTPVGAYY
jgi:hypothetical protein